MTKISSLLFVILLCAAAVISQPGGTYELKQTVAATGGAISGGTYSIVYTVGRTITAIVTGSPFVLPIGFWTPDAFGPTAATVSVSGRVTNAGGQGIRNVILKLTDSSGSEMSARTTTFGLYSFSGVRTGETYLLTIKSGRFVFDQPSRLLTVTDELTGIDFSAGVEPAQQ